MIQLIKLRSFMKDGKEKKYDTFIHPDLAAQSVADLFENLDAYLAQIPAAENYNLFYTLAHCRAGEKRAFESLDVMFFDIDGIDVSRVDEYATVVCSTLQVPKEHCGIVCSGNGLHIIVGLKYPIVDPKFFQTHRFRYKAVLEILRQALVKAELPLNKENSMDPSVFDHRRFFRIPGTVNRKPGKPDTVARLLNATILPSDFDLITFSGIPLIPESHQVEAKSAAAFIKADNAAVFTQCSFMQHVRTHPAEIDEPELYAALSIMGRMTNAEAVAVNTFQPRFGKRHHGGSEDDIKQKLEHATLASGPRLCSSIAHLWKGCATCPFAAQKSSPIMLKSPDSIKTESTGFHDMVFDPETQKVKRGKPNYKDLRQFFENKHLYRSHDKFVWVWKETHFEEMPHDWIMNFAQKHFDPYASSTMRKEFLDLIQTTNLVRQDEWSRSTIGKVNLKNGVLDIRTGELHAHSPSFGFKYVLPYSYDPGAVAPRFEQFLSEVCAGRPELVQTLLEFGGYCLAGSSCTYQKALVLEGEGNNGKSTFIEVIKAVAGGGAYTTLSFKDMENVERRSSLDGKLFNITEETPNKLFDTTSFKNLISGGEMQIRKLYRNAYNFRNRAKLIFSCNQMPMSNDASRGFFRRFLIVPFGVKFSQSLGNIDRHIGEKLQEELPGILNAFLLGYASLLKNDTFSKGDDETDEDLIAYQETVDPVLLWCRENVVIYDIDAPQSISVPLLYDNFRQWCESNGYESKNINSISLSIQLRRYIPDIKTRRIRDRTQRRLQGVGVREGPY
jgi:putative DNA primase/helicase